MAGVITGSIDHRAGAPAQVADDNNQEVFTILYNWLDSKYTRIASNFGDTAGPGAGFDFHDGAAPSRGNAYAVFRAAAASDPFNILIQWADTDVFGASPGNPGQLAGASLDGVGICIAMREDGTDPWGGGTADVGADAKSSPVWTPGGSTLHVIDRANSPGGPAGSFDTNKENTGFIADLSGTGSFERIHVVGDDDGFVVLNDNGDDGSYACHYFGAYAPRTGIVIPSPLCAIYGTDLPFWNLGVTRGSILGNTATEGGCLGRLLADGVRSWFVGISSSGGTGPIFQPNSQLATPELEPELIAVLRDELNFGLAGYLPSALLTSVISVGNHETNAAATRAYIGDTVIANRKWSIPWDAGSPPGVLNARAGRQF